VKGKFEEFAGDVRDPNGVRAAMRGCDDMALHLAALIAIPYSYHSPDTCLETNIRGSFVSYGGISGGNRSVDQQTVTTRKLMPIVEVVAIPLVANHVKASHLKACLRSTMRHVRCSTSFIAAKALRTTAPEPRLTRQ
jgi:hypothetical protein